MQWLEGLGHRDGSCSLDDLHRMEGEGGWVGNTKATHHTAYDDEKTSFPRIGGRIRDVGGLNWAFLEGLDIFLAQLAFCYLFLVLNHLGMGSSHTKLRNCHECSLESFFY